MKSTRRRPRRSTTATTMATSTLICLLALTVLLMAHTAVAAAADDDRESVETSGPEVAENLPSEQLQLMSTRAPRQQFRIHQLTSGGSSSSSPFKLRTIKSAVAARAKLNGRRQEQLEHSNSNSNTTTTNSTKGQAKKMISSAVLKKLLSQTLPKLNSTSVFGAGGQLPSLSSNHRSINAYGPATNNTSAGPHFKFVFIQRATATPSSSSDASTMGAVKRPLKAHFKSTNSTSTGTKQPQQQSLAASVSRQLANSLLYSAASSLMGNLTSISALANTLQQPDDQSAANNELDVASSSTTTTTSPTVIAKPTGEEEVETNDIRRLSKTSSPRVSLSASATATKSSRPGKPKSRPSKIYNLPVKFVANGQPNHVAAFHSIKQHFATIKKLQSAMSTSSGGQKKKTSSTSANSIPKLKGKNSRLIYLPLKYLSNAKSSSVLSVISAASTKASHKSSSTKTGAH